ncbi:MAG TPA: HD domain-containing phosphohydrolase [Kiloniellales bacterium]|jgi:response regulator RpfG family c-di-GMP phosphodiesterase
MSLQWPHPMKPKVLLVDDEENILTAFTRHLRQPFNILTATDAQKGLDILGREKDVAVVVSDMQMPGMNGIEFLAAVRTKFPDISRIMLTGNADQKTAVAAVNEGSVFRFCDKPCPPEALQAAIQAGVDYHALITAEKTLLEQTLSGSVRVLVDVLSVVAPEAFKISRQLRKWARALQPALNMRNAWELDLAAMLSPIGEIVVPAEVTVKYRSGHPLTPIEMDILNRVPVIGSKLIGNIPRLQNVSRIIYFQDKGFDGSGFPSDYVAGKDIPLGARVMKVLIDLAKAAKDGTPNQQTFAALNKHSKIYDPEVLAIIRDFFVGGQRDTGAPLPYEILSIAIADLRPGDRLSAHVTTQDARLILSSGEELSGAQIENLQDLCKIKRMVEPVHVQRPIAGAGANT